MHKDSVVEMRTQLFLILLYRWRINNLDTITSEDYDDDYEDIENFVYIYH